MRIVTVVGARPQFIKAAAISRQLRKRHHEFLIHTGQHYDYAMSGVFFDGLDLPPPDVDLAVGSGSHALQTGHMLIGIEKILVEERPDGVLVYGDTNSTLAGALAAAKVHIPIVHVEAGLRSYNRRMPEEVNRVLTDHLSRLLLCPGKLAVENLAAEGITKNVHAIGDVMLDVLTWTRERAAARLAEILNRHSVQEKKFLLMTMHRSENTDDPARLAGIVEALNALSEPIVFPVHPRSKKVIAESGHVLKPHVKTVDPFGYFDMVAISGAARMILTDSGGLQKEAYWLGVPCVTLRDETEWVETVEAGWNVLAGAQRDSILKAVTSFAPPAVRPALYGDGSVAGRCVDLLQYL